MGRKLRLVLLFAAIVLSQAACDKIISTKISDIISSPGKYSEKNVTVQGKVTSSLIVAGIGYFVLSDGSGEISVIPSKTYPQVGETVKIKGTVKAAFVVGEKSLVGIVESEQKD